MHKRHQPNSIILASASERRRKILADLGLVFHVAATKVKEDDSADHPELVAKTNALRKLDAAKAKDPNAWIIAADTIVVFDGKAIHKPATLDHAFAFFRLFSSQTHAVMTATAMQSPSSPRPLTRVTTSTVTFLPLNEARIRAYFTEVNPLDKAGGYDIDQRPDLIIATYHGSLTNIAGLPVEVVRPWLEREGLLPSAQHNMRKAQQP